MAYQEKAVKPVSAKTTSGNIRITAAIGMLDADGNPVGILNLSGDRTDQAAANAASEAFCNIVNKLSVEQAEACVFHPFVRNGKTEYRLAAANNQTIGFVNSDKHNLDGWTLANVSVSPYNQILTTEDDFARLLLV